MNERRLLMPLFVLWTLAGLMSVLLGWDRAWLEGFLESRSIEPTHLLAQVLFAIEALGDALWLTLAALTLLSVQCRRSGLARGLIDFCYIIGIALVLEWVGVKTGWPFGQYVYSERLGAHFFGAVPWSIPLAWYVVVVGSYHMALFLVRLMPSARSLTSEKPGSVLGLCALLAVLTDVNLEPVASQIRHYWQWQSEGAITPGAVPWQNYLSWLVSTFFFAALLSRGREEARENLSQGPSTLAVSVFVLVNLFFLFIRVGSS